MQGCLPPGANVFVAARTLAIRSPIDILMVTTMELMWTVNSMLSWGCNYVMQWNLGWSVANNKKKTAAHTSGTCLCWLTYVTLYAESVLQCKRQFARHGQISECHTFAPPNAAPAHCRPGWMPPSHRHCMRWWRCHCAAGTWDDDDDVVVQDVWRREEASCHSTRPWIRRSRSAAKNTRWDGWFELKLSSDWRK